METNNETVARSQVRSNNAPLLKVDNLTKRFGKKVAVENMSIEVRLGECLGIVGPNGAGKTND